MGTGSGMWSNISPSNQFMDNPSESQSANSSSGPNITTTSTTDSNAAGDSASFDIPEFVPGKPWQGGSNNKIEDDPNITPGSVARSLSVSTATLNGSGKPLSAPVLFCFRGNTTQIVQVLCYCCTLPIYSYHNIYYNNVMFVPSNAFIMN